MTAAAGTVCIITLVWLIIGIAASISFAIIRTRTRSNQHQSDAQARAKGAGSVVHTSTNASNPEHHHA